MSLLLRSQRGFSLVEVLVGAVLLGILVAGVISFMGSNQTFTNKVQAKSSCENEANRILANFKNKALIRNQIPLDIAVGTALTAGTNLVPPNNPDARELGLTYAQRWSGPAPMTLEGAANAPTLYPPALLMGTMTALETLYALSPTICNGNGNRGIRSNAIPAAYTQLSTDGLFSNVFTQNAGLINPVAYLRLQAFNTNDLNAPPIACGGPIRVIPPPGGANNLNIVPNGMNSTAGTTLERNYPNGPAPVLNDLTVGQKPAVAPVDNRGWLLTVQIEHDNRTGGTEICTVSERFQYPALAGTNTPLVIDGIGGKENLNTSINSGGGAAPAYPGNTLFRACTTAPATGNINIQVNNARSGSFFLCRNLSRQRALNSPVADLNITKAIGAPLQQITFNAGAAGYGAANGARRQSFYSTETDSNPTVPTYASGDYDRFTLGVQYPARGIRDPGDSPIDHPEDNPNPNLGTGTYFCHSGDGCDGLPYFQSDTTAGPGAPLASVPSEGHFQPSDHEDEIRDDARHTPAAEDRWQPCERSAIRCASTANYNTDNTQVLHAPTSATYDVATSSYQLSYTNLPPGCEVHIQIAEVDSAYNIRTTEVREYIYEKLPGNKLCWTGNGTVTTGRPANRWYFACDPTPGDNSAPVGGGNLPRCAIHTARAPGANQPAIFHVQPNGPSPAPAGGCCIDFPGDAGVTNDWRAGTWIDNTPAGRHNP